MNSGSNDHSQKVQSPAEDLILESRVSKRLYTVPEAAEYLGMTDWGIRGLITNGKIDTVRNGRRLFLAIEDMDRWIAENKQRERTY